jgi:tetratricopeptide (TPR) repeat protein
MKKMQRFEFHPLELVLPGFYLLVVYFMIFATFNPFTSMAENPRYTLERVETLKKRSNYLQALTHIKRLTKQFPTNHVYWQQEADIEHRLAQSKDEARALEKVMIYSSMPGEACPALGQAYESSGEKSKALEAHLRCLKLEPTNIDFQFYLAHSEERFGSIDNAFEGYQKCLKHIETHMDCNTGLARVYLRKGQPNEALNVLAAPALRAKVNNNADALLARAISQRRLDRPKLATEDLEKATKLAPEYTDLWIELGNLYIETGNKAAALKHLQQALTLDPSNLKIKAQVHGLESQ